MRINLPVTFKTKFGPMRALHRKNTTPKSDDELESYVDDSNHTNSRVGRKITNITFHLMATFRELFTRVKHYGELRVSALKSVKLKLFSNEQDASSSCTKSQCHTSLRKIKPLPSINRSLDVKEGKG